jgi:hypothetical protein
MMRSIVACPNGRRPNQKFRHGYMARYAKQVSSASKGAVVR